MPGRLSYAFRLLCAPERYSANSENNPRRLRELRFSTPSGFARLSRHMQGYATRFQPSSSTCASLREASQRRRRGLLSSIRLIQAEKPLQLRASPLPHSYTPIAVSSLVHAPSVVCPYRTKSYIHCTGPSRGGGPGPSLISISA